MNLWDDLPNARYIDWVLASLKQHPDIWTSAPADAAQAAWDAARDAAQRSARKAAWHAAWYGARDAEWGAARDAAQNVILALIAYDDCAHLLNMSSEQLKTWAALSENPAAILLLPAVIVREHIAQLEKA